MTKYRRQNEPVPTREELVTKYKETAIRSLKRFRIIDFVAGKEKIKASQEDVDREIQKLPICITSRLIPLNRHSGRMAQLIEFARMCVISVLLSFLSENMRLRCLNKAEVLLLHNGTNLQEMRYSVWL